MLVIISDLHLTDGSLGQSLPADAFRTFAARLRELAVAASHRADGKYRPVECVDLMLLGDVLDLIRSARWLDAEVRPWDDPRSPHLAAAVARIVAGILTANADSVAVLQSLVAGGIQISPDHCVPVRIQYLLGSCDWPLRLPGAAYDRVRQSIVARLGLSNRSDFPFPHDPAECGEILQTLRRHRLLARHGDIFDPLSFAGDRSISSLADAIVIELINRFVLQLQIELATELPAPLFAALRAIENVRPILHAPAWIETVLESACLSPALRAHVQQTWDRLADRFLESDLIPRQETWQSVDLLDGLQQVLKSDSRSSGGRRNSIVNWLHGLQEPERPAYLRQALAEQDFRNGAAQFVVYGHTHVGPALHSACFSLGAWGRVCHLAPEAAEDQWITTDAISCVAFFHEDENLARPYEIWSAPLNAAAALPRAA